LTDTAATPKLQKLSDTARAAGVTYRSVRRACAEGRLTMFEAGELDALGRPTRLRVIEDAKLRRFLAGHNRRRRRQKQKAAGA
jgi:hypothetical protein